MAAILVNQGRKVQYVGTAAERAGVTLETDQAGSIFDESDTGFRQIWNGAAWFKKLYPAS